VAKRSRRKKKQGGTGEGLLFKVFITLFILLVMIGSFLLFVAWWYFERKGATLPKPQSIQYFSHTKDEIKAINQYEDSLERIYSRLDQIEFEGRALTKRQDGMYNERSKKGKLFNSDINELSPKADNIEQSIADLESFPEKRLNEWAFYSSIYLALRHSVISYIVSFALFVWIQPVWVIELSQFLQKYTFLDFYASYPVAYGASVGSLVISLSVLGVSFFSIRSKKKESLNSPELIESSRYINSSEIVDVNIPDFIAYLSKLSHTDLKKLADEFDIQADRRSKSTILDAISEESEDIRNKIYSRCAPLI
jgi:hypothetical protein